MKLIYKKMFKVALKFNADLYFLYFKYSFPHVFLSNIYVLDLTFYFFFYTSSWLSNLLY